LGYRIANEIGVKAEFKNVDWDVIFQELLDKKIDMIMASVTITDERKKLYNFSEPYINAGQVIISRKDNPITTVAQLQGKKISVQKDTTNEKEAYKHTSKDLVLVYSEYSDIAKAVSVGSSEAALSDLTIAKGLIGNYDNIKITSDPFTNEYYGIVMRKEDTDLQKKVNAALAVLRVNGVLTDLKQKWLE
jgi:ABC-type amino acid transport substrate-binding protein